MKKKKIAITICTIAITGILAVGGSLAYFTDRTEEVKNVFTTNFSDLAGTIEENFDEEKAESYLPGDVIHKEPWLKNEENSINAWAAIKVDIIVDGVAVSYNDFVEKFATISFNGLEGFNNSDFELINGDYSQNDSLVFAYKSILEPGNTTPAIFDNIQVNVGSKIVSSSKYVNRQIYKEVEAGTANAVKLSDDKFYVLVDTSRELLEAETEYYVVNEDGSIEKVDAEYELPRFEIEVKGYMIQADNVDYETAKSELVALVGRSSQN